MEKKDVTACEKVRFFKQWELHREDREPLKWTTSFASSVSEEQVSSLDFRKKWLKFRCPPDTQALRTRTFGGSPSTQDGERHFVPTVREASL
eukprot:5338958-Amphidinium_carterae.1